MYTGKDICELGDHMLKLASQMEPETAQRSLIVIEVVLGAYAAEIGGHIELNLQPDGSLDIIFYEPVPAGHPSKAH